MRDLLTKRAGLVAEMEALAAKGTAISAEEEKRFDAIQGEIDGIDKAVARLEKAQGAASAQHPADPHVQVGNDRAGDRPFASLGEQVLAVIQSSQQGATIDPRLLKVRAATGMGSGVPSDGGFAVQQDLAADMLTRTNETGVLLPLVRRLPISANANGLKMNGIDENSRANGSRWGGVQVYWRAEAASVMATHPKWQQFELSLESLMGLCYLTQELTQDAAALGAVVTQAFAEEFGFKLDDGIINGSGAGQFLGILQSAGRVTVPKATGQAADTVIWDNIKAMWARCWGRARRNASWFINQDVEQQLMGMSMPVGTGGVPVYMPAGGASERPYSTLLGRPIIPIEQAATVGDEGDVILADLSQYLMIDKGGMQQAESIHVLFTYGENVVRFIYRCNGAPLWKQPLTPFKGTVNTQSPFVTLATRS